MSALPAISRPLNDPQRLGCAGGIRSNKHQPFQLTIIWAHIDDILSALQDEAIAATNYFQTSRYAVCAERFREAALMAGWYPAPETQRALNDMERFARAAEPASGKYQPFLLTLMGADIQDTLSALEDSATKATSYYQTSRYAVHAERLREAALIAGW